MPNIQFKWKVYCNDESSFFETWSENLPVNCPNNTSHSIDHERTAKVHQVQPQQVKITEETVPLGAVKTNRNFAMRAHCFDVEPGVTYTTTSKTFTHPISLINVMVDVSDNMESDELCVDIYPDTIIGVPVVGVTSGQSTFYVNETVTQNILNGFNVNIINGTFTATDDLGACLSIDPINHIITTEKSTTQPFDPFTSYIRMSVRFFDAELGQKGQLHAAMNTIGGQYVPAGTIIRGTYINKNGEGKRVRLYYEYYY